MHPNKSGVVENRSLLQAPYNMKQEHFYNLGQDYVQDKVYLLNRIDSSTSGLLLVALNIEVARAVRELFQQQLVQKTYLAIVKGRPPGVPEIWTDWLERSKSNRGDLSVYTSSSKSGCLSKLAKTRVQWMMGDNNRLGISLMRLIPYTGRTHQLRVQCAARSCPILGDSKYGDFKFNRKIAQVSGIKRLFLHAYEMRLQFALHKQLIEFKVKSPIPDSFNQLIQVNRDILSNTGSGETKTPFARESARSPVNKKRSRRRFL